MSLLLRWAFIFSLGLAPGFSASKILEAELGTRTGGAVVSTAVSGYSGSGYVVGFQSAADTVGWSFTNQPGIYRLVVRFRTPYGEKGFEGSFNGRGFSGFMGQSNVFFNVEAGLVEVIAGTNTLRIGGGWNYYEVDRAELSPYTPTALLPVAPTLVDPQAAFAARQLMTAIAADYGQLTWAGQNNKNDAAYIQNYSGQSPAILEGDMIDYSPSRVQFQNPPANYSESYIALEGKGHALSLAWHWNAPTNLYNTTEKPWWGGFYTDHTSFDFAAALANTNSTAYALMLRDIDAIAIQLRKFSDKNIPILWRPLHESEGGWFWWGAKGPANFKQLWRLLYQRLTVHHQLHNLIWVQTTSNLDWYAGDDVVDIIGVDAYPSDPADNLASTYLPLRARFDGKKILALSEFGGIPDVERMRNFGVYWAYFSCWTGSFLTGAPVSTLNRIYNSPQVLTLDEAKAMVPKILTQTTSDFNGVGPRGQPFRVLSKTNLAAPAWNVATNTTFAGGVFSYTNRVTQGSIFYRLTMP